MVCLDTLYFMLEERKHIFEVAFRRFCSLRPLELPLEVVYTSHGLEVVDQADYGLLLPFLGEFMLFQKTVHLSGDTEDEWPGTDLNFFVDEPGSRVKIEAKFAVCGKTLLFEQLFNVGALLLASLDDSSHLIKERGVFLVLLDSLSGMDKGNSQLLNLLL